MFIGTAVAGAATTFNLLWLAEFLLLDCTALANCTALKVTVLGEGVICDLDNAGLDALTGIRDRDTLANRFKIPLADGILKGKNVEIVVTAATNDVEVYGMGDNNGDNYVKCLRQVILANSGAILDKFAFLGIPAMHADDELNISFVDGLTHKFDIVDLAARLAMSQSQIGSPGIDNMEGTIDSISYIPIANRTVYTVKFKPVA